MSEIKTITNNQLPVSKTARLTLLRHKAASRAELWQLWNKSPGARTPEGKAIMHHATHIKATFVLYWGICQSCCGSRRRQLKLKCKTLDLIWRWEN